jgi:long-chain acyl-CoA synthetase
MNLKSLLEGAAANFAGKSAIVMGERRVSFTELEEISNRVANALIKMGVRKGDRVATIQSSNPEFVTVFFGIIKAGAIAVPLDARYVVDELSSLFDDCTPKVLVAENPALETAVAALSRFPSIEHVIGISVPSGGKVTGYDDLIADSPADAVNIPIAEGDTAIISYTGGPTVNPHGVALSHQSLCIEATDSGKVFRQTADDVLMAFALPMYHQFGLTSVLLASIAKGSTVVVVPGTGRSIDSFMEAVEKEKGTIYMGVPYIYALMINVARREGIRHDLSSLRFCAAGGAPLEVEIIDQFKELYGLDILDIWGQTETVSHVTVQPVDGTGKRGATGKPMPCWEMKIFDENNNELPPNREGEIVIRGPVMTGFYNRPEATAAIIRNGWLHTGDIGRIDEDGFLFITGRKRRMLILKGQNIFPSDIEAVILTHPQVAEVKVIGVPDLVRGETVKAMIRLKPREKATEQEIRQFCQNRMADYKLPREIVFVDAIPEATPLWERRKNPDAPGTRIE